MYDAHRLVLTTVGLLLFLPTCAGTYTLTTLVQAKIQQATIHHRRNPTKAEPYMLDAIFKRQSCNSSNVGIKVQEFLSRSISRELKNLEYLCTMYQHQGLSHPFTTLHS
ncbi:uncharacterized protein GGS25DRAFT_411021 [Hypoxylon fragiforme]|uniref:uncharacterized protein n=1 Tax=Hypoxylon fragiforme TaxID=63214 RepID=UPI0020C5E9B9|nr:uncharacterized protein GGS25DRAFT_411021 [Hypoxylon fragiforme]KAI2605033.1 hypothetical protein GGS25DRAFT_411021 [Hypoxylon fragiforme]